MEMVGHKTFFFVLLGVAILVIAIPNQCNAASVTASKVAIEDNSSSGGKQTLIVGLCKDAGEIKT